MSQSVPSLQLFWLLLMTGATECDIYEKCTAVLSGTLGHNEDGYAPESTAAIIQWLQSLKLGGE